MKRLVKLSLALTAIAFLSYDISAVYKYVFFAASSDPGRFFAALAAGGVFLITYVLAEESL